MHKRGGKCYLSKDKLGSISDLKNWSRAIKLLLLQFFLPPVLIVLLSTTTTTESTICCFVIGQRPASHHVNKEFPGVSHSHAQGLARCSELGWYRGQLSARWGAGGSCGQVWGLRGQARGAIDEARAVGN